MQAPTAARKTTQRALGISFQGFPPVLCSRLLKSPDVLRPDQDRVPGNGHGLLLFLDSSIMHQTAPYGKEPPKWRNGFPFGSL